MMSTNRYQVIGNLIIKLLEDQANTYSGDQLFEKQGGIAGCLIRTAGHDFMDYRVDGGGGSDGCFNLQDDDNKGLQSCLTIFGITGIYDKIVNELGYSISLADFFVIAGEVSAGRLADDYELDQEGNYKAGTFFAKFRDNFKAGRKTAKVCDHVGRMPNPEHGCFGKGTGKDGLKQIFVDHIFKSAKWPWTYSTAINGAHTIGKASLENSGYEGFWGTKK